MTRLTKRYKQCNVRNGVHLLLQCIGPDVWYTTVYTRGHHWRPQWGRGRLSARRPHTIDKAWGNSGLAMSKTLVWAGGGRNKAHCENYPPTQGVNQNGGGETKRAHEMHAHSLTRGDYGIIGASLREGPQHHSFHLRQVQPRCFLRSRQSRDQRGKTGRRAPAPRPLGLLLVAGGVALPRRRHDHLGHVLGATIRCKADRQGPSPLRHQRVPSLAAEGLRSLQHLLLDHLHRGRQDLRAEGNEAPRNLAASRRSPRTTTTTSKEDKVRGWAARRHLAPPATGARHAGERGAVSHSVATLSAARNRRPRAAPPPPPPPTGGSRHRSRRPRGSTLHRR